MRPLPHLALLALVLLSGASPAADAEAAAAGPGETERGATLFARHCKVCHGEGGEGDGMLAAHLKVPPGDLTEPERMGRRSDEDLLAVVRDGGPARELSSVMTAFGDRLDAQQLADVVAFVRALSRTPEPGD